MPSTTKSFRPQLYDQSSSASSLSGMEKPIPSFKDFVQIVASAPKPTTRPTQKPLPPTPLIVRRSSSVYSQDDLATPDVFRPWSESSATDFFLQPIRYSVSSPQLPHAEVVQFLEPKVYSPNRPFATVTDTVDFARSQSPLSSQVSLATTEESSPVTSEQVLVEPRAYSPASTGSRDTSEGSQASSPIAQTLLFSPLWSPRIAHVPKRPLSPARSLDSPLNSTRKISTEKARAALGLDLSEASSLGSRSGNRRGVPPRHLDYAHYIPTARLYPRRSFDDPNPAEEIEEKSEAQLIAEEYHALLTDQYRHEKDARTRVGILDGAKREARTQGKNGEVGLVPAPLFWRKRNSIDQTTNHKSENGSGGFRQRLPSLPHIKIPDGLQSLTGQAMGRRRSLTVVTTHNKGTERKEDRSRKQNAQKHNNGTKDKLKLVSAARDLLPLHTPPPAKDSVTGHEKRNFSEQGASPLRHATTMSPRLHRDRLSGPRTPPPLVRLDHKRKISPPISNPLLSSPRSNKSSMPLSPNSDASASSNSLHPLRQHKPSMALVTNLQNTSSHLRSSSKAFFERAKDSIQGQVAALPTLHMSGNQSSKEDKRRQELKRSIRLVGEVEAQAHMRQYSARDGVTQGRALPLASAPGSFERERSVGPGEMRGRTTERRGSAARRRGAREVEREEAVDGDIEIEVNVGLETGSKAGGWL